MFKNFRSPSNWYLAAFILIVVEVVVVSLVSLGMLVAGIVVVGSGHGNAWAGLIGVMLLVFGGIGVLLSGLLWYLVVALGHGSQIARWIFGILAGLNLVVGIPSLLFTSGASIFSVAWHGVIFYGLLLDPQVRAAFGDQPLSSWL